MEKPVGCLRRRGHVAGQQTFACPQPMYLGRSIPHGFFHVELEETFQHLGKIGRS